MADDWIDTLPEELEAEVLPSASPLELRAQEAITTGNRSKKLEFIKKTREQLFEQSAEILSHALAAGDIDPMDDPEAPPPPDWLKSLGRATAAKRQRIARAAWLNRKEAPSFIELARSVYLGVLKAEGAEKAAPQLNVQVVQVNISQPREYEELADGDTV